MDRDLLEQNLTALALGELDDADASALAARLAEWENGETAIAETQRLAATLRDALATEDSPGISDLNRLAIEKRLRELSDSDVNRRLYPARGRWVAWMPMAAAACALLASGATLMVLLSQQSLPAGAGGRGSGSPVAGVRLTSDANTVVLDRRDLLAQMRGFRKSASSQATPAYTGAFNAPPIPHATPDADAFRDVAATPISAFPLHVNRASFEMARQFVTRGLLPPAEAVQIESLVNAFEASDDGGSVADSANPAAIDVEVSACPWQPDHRLARITLRRRDHGGAEQGAVSTAQARVEFNPARVAAFRLIGYDNLWNESERTAAEMGYDLPGDHTLTVLYEIVPAAAGSNGSSPPLKYQQPPRLTLAAENDELGTVTLRYRLRYGQAVHSVAAVVADRAVPLAKASADFKLAAAAAEAGLVLRSPNPDRARLAAAAALAEQAVDADAPNAPNDRAILARFIRAASRQAGG